MKTKDEIIKEITEIVNSERRVVKRVKRLIDAGYITAERRCGCGGKLQVIELRHETRIQIGYAHAYGNYAECVILQK